MKHRREVLWIVIEPSLGQFIRFLNKYYLLRLKYFFKVRFASEIELILPKCANITRTSEKNTVSTMLFS